MRNVTGTLFTGKEPRIVNMEGAPASEQALPAICCLSVTKTGLGLIGGIGTLLASSGYNIADFRFGRTSAGGDAICLISLDQPLPDDLFRKIHELPQVKSKTFGILTLYISNEFNFSRYEGFKPDYRLCIFHNINNSCHNFFDLVPDSSVRTGQIC